MLRQYLYYLTLFLFFNVTCYATESTLSVLSDPKNDLSIEQVINQDILFKKEKHQTIYTQKNVTTWAKINFKNLPLGSEFILSIDKPLESQISMFVIQDANIIKRLIIPENNNIKPQLQAIIPHLKVSQNIINQKIILKIKSQFDSTLVYELNNKDNFDYKVQKVLFGFGIELGLLYFVTIFISIIAVLRKKYDLVYLASYILFLSLYFSAQNGSIYYYLPNTMAKVLTEYNNNLTIISMLFGICFLFDFLNKHKSFSSIRSNPLTVLFGVLIVVIFTSLFNHHISNQLVYLCNFLSLSLSITYLMINLKSKKTDSLMLLAAISPLGIMASIWLFVFFGMIDKSLFTVVTKLSITSHILLLCIALYLKDKYAHDRFVFYSSHDKNTGLPNRRELKRCLNNLIEQNVHHTLVLFKPLVLNNTRLYFGEEYADKHIKRVFKKLKIQINMLHKDTNFRHCFYRLDDVSFALIIKGKLSLSKIEQYVCVLSAVFEEGIEYKNKQIVDQIDVGVAHFPIHAKHADDLLQKAMQALSIRTNGSERWQIYDITNSLVSQRRVLLATELNKAIKKEQFELYFQPQINLSSNSIHGAEVLLRWKHPEFGYVSPEEFIPIAESTGQIYAITEWVIFNSMQAQKQLLKRFPWHNLAINISGHDANNKELIIQLITLTNELSLQADQITLEVSESVIVSADVDLLPMIDNLKELGFKIAVDDYGSSYSSVTCLSKFNCDILKIDSHFIFDPEISKTNKVIFKTSCDIGHNLGCTVVAEGIETRSSYEILKLFKCDIAQGFYISKPRSLNDYEHWVKKVSTFDDLGHYLDHENNEKVS